MHNLECVTVDIASPLAAIKMDLTSIGFRDGRFDVVICSHVLEHIPDDRKAMKELFRVLRPGGWAIIQSPVDYERNKTLEDWTIVSPKERKRVFGQDDHVRLYGIDYKERLESAGFIVNFDRLWNQLGEELRSRYGHDDMDNLICFCTKPTDSWHQWIS